MNLATRRIHIIPFDHDRAVHRLGQKYGGLRWLPQQDEVPVAGPGVVEEHVRQPALLLPVVVERQLCMHVLDDDLDVL